MPITPLPEPPSRDDPANFPTRADDFLGALQPFANELEAARVEILATGVTANSAASNASTAASAAETARAAAVVAQGVAQTAATNAAAAPASPATSTTSMTLGTGNKTLTVQAGKLFGVGQYIAAARTSAPVASREVGIVTSYNSGTGVLNYTVPADAVVGSGTFTDWTVTSASAPVDTSALTAAIALKQDIAEASKVVRNSQTGAGTYTLQLSDAGKNIDRYTASASTVTVPPNSSVAIPIDTVIFVTQTYTGQVSIVAGAGVLLARAGGLKVAERFKAIALQKTDTNTWLVFGGVA